MALRRSRKQGRGLLMQHQKAAHQHWIENRGFLMRNGGELVIGPRL